MVISHTIQTDTSRHFRKCNIHQQIMEQNIGPFGCVCKGDTLLAGIIAVIYFNMGFFLGGIIWSRGRCQSVCWVFPVASWRRYCVRLLLIGYTCTPCQVFFKSSYFQIPICKHMVFFFWSTRLCCWVICADFCYCWPKMFVVLRFLFCVLLLIVGWKMCDIHVSAWAVVRQFLTGLTERARRQQKTGSVCQGKLTHVPQTSQTS